MCFNTRAKARASCTSISIRIRSVARTAKSCRWSADSREALKMLREAALAAKVNGSKWAAWTKQVQGSVAAWQEDLERVSRESMHEGKLNPYHIMRLIDQHVGGDDMLVADTGYMAAWAVTVLQQKKAGRNTLRAAGSLGWAFPAAFGAKLAVGPKRRVFGLTGDGGLGYHLARSRNRAAPETSGRAHRDEQLLARV